MDKSCLRLPERPTGAPTTSRQRRSSLRSQSPGRPRHRAERRHVPRSPSSGRSCKRWASERSGHTAWHAPAAPWPTPGHFLASASHTLCRMRCERGTSRTIRWRVAWSIAPPYWTGQVGASCRGGSRSRVNRAFSMAAAEETLRASGVRRT